MKRWKDYFYYLFIVLSCLFGSFFAGKVDFFRELITLCYVCVAIYALIETLIMNITYFKYKLQLIRILYLFLCVASSFYALHLTDEILVRSELKCSIKSINIKDIAIKPKASGYLVDIEFHIPYNKYVDVMQKVKLNQVNLSEIHPIGLKTRDIINRMRINGMDDLTCFSLYKDDKSKILHGVNSFYDKKTETAYYEHMNYKNKDN
jgi:hypothetical protein